MATLTELLKNLTPEQQHYIARLVASLPETEGGLNLPLSNTAMDRAKAMGGIDVYHGTAHDIRNIDPKLFGSSTGAESAKKAFWTVSDPNTARGYAEYAARDVPIKKLLALAEKAEKKGDWDLYDDYIRQAEEYEAAMAKEPLAGQNIMPLVQLGPKKLTKDLGGAEFTDVQSEINQYLNKAKSSGASEAVLQNLADDVYFSGRPATHYATFKPESLRSRFAAFNPWRKHEADLLASHPLASAGAALAASGGLAGMGREYLDQPVNMGPDVARVAQATGLQPMSRGEALKSAVSTIPGIGEVLSGVEGLQAATEGKWSEAGLGALGAAGLVPMGGLGGMIRASHGSPHAFDKFQTSKIGTGEGAQAYSHGLYFGEGFDSPVAQEYKKQLAGDVFNVAGDVFDPSSLQHLNVRSLTNKGNLEGAINKAKEIASSDSPVAGRAKNDLSILLDIQAKGGLTPAQGYLYNTELKWPSAAKEASDPLSPEHFMVWDAPYQQQTQSIQDLLKQEYEDVFNKRSGIRKSLQERFAAQGKAPPMRSEMSPITGQQLYEHLAAKFNSPAQASQYLSSIGIPGMRYLDQGSRLAGKGTQNYVVYDENIPEIVTRNNMSLSGLLRK